MELLAFSGKKNIDAKQVLIRMLGAIGPEALDSLVATSVTDTLSYPKNALPAPKEFDLSTITASSEHSFIAGDCHVVKKTHPSITALKGFIVENNKVDGYGHAKIGNLVQDNMMNARRTLEQIKGSFSFANMDVNGRIMIGAMSRKGIPDRVVDNPLFVLGTTDGFFISDEEYLLRTLQAMEKALRKASQLVKLIPDNLYSIHRGIPNNLGALVRKV